VASPLPPVETVFLTATEETDCQILPWNAMEPLAGPATTCTTKATAKLHPALLIYILPKWTLTSGAFLFQLEHM